MVRKRSKLLTLLLAAVMAAGSLTTALAVDLPPDKGDLAIHKYLMPNTGIPGAMGNGTEIAPQNLPNDAKALPGVTFRLYKVEIGADGIYPAPGTLELDFYTATTSFTDSNDKSFAVTPAIPASVETDSAGTAQAQNLPQGIYLVVENGDARVASPAAPFVVAVPMSNPAGDGWLDIVHVYPKNEELVFEKTVTADAVRIGDPIVYTLVPSVPTDIKEAKKYEIIDQLDEALTYNGVSCVKAAATKAGLATGQALTLNTHYTVGETGNAVTVSLTPDGRDYLGENGYKFLEITLDTIVNKKILDKAGYVLGNTARIELTNRYEENKTISSGGSGTNPIGPTNVHTAAIAVTACDGSTNALLGDAKFKIASSPANAAAGKYLRIDETTGKIFDVGDPGYNTAADWVVTTNGSGRADFKGIKDYTGTADSPSYLSYYLVETQAPAGYNMLREPVEVTFDSSVSANNYTKSVTVKHNKGFTLPQTGGMGTLIFTVAGIALVGTGVILLLSSKKKKRKRTVN